MSTRGCIARLMLLYVMLNYRRFTNTGFSDKEQAVRICRIFAPNPTVINFVVNAVPARVSDVNFFKIFECIVGWVSHNHGCRTS